MNELSFNSVVKPEEIATVAELAGDIWREHYPGMISSDQVEYMLKNFQSVPAISKQIREGYLYYLLSSGREPVGYLAIVPRGKEIFLSKLYMESSERGKGYGRMAVAFIEGKARELGASMITLTVNRNNKDSIEAYKKFGFREAGKLETDIGEGFKMCDYKMVKEIGQSKYIGL